MVTDKVINAKVTELKKLRMARDGLDAAITQLENTIKSAMDERNISVFIGDAAKVTWSTVSSSRFDSTAFKRAYPDEYNKYLKQSTTRRFTIV